MRVMTSDQIAFWGLVVSCVALLIGAVSAVAAIFAVIYAKGSATQKSLSVVEQNTAVTAEQIAAVKGHITQVENHLRIQNKREALDIAAFGTSIVVNGEGWNDETQRFVLTVRTPGVSLSQVDLVSAAGLHSGSIPCTQVEPGVFETSVQPQMFAKWFNSGDLLPPGNRRIVHIRANLLIDGVSLFKDFKAEAVLQMQQRSGSTLPYYRTSGQS